MLMSRFPAALCALGVFIVPAVAQDLQPLLLPPPQSSHNAEYMEVSNNQLDASQRATLQKANRWFNSTLVLSAQFTQTAADGAQSQGRVFMAKPGRVRFQYARPSPLEIIADGRSVAIRDRALNTQDIYPLSQTPLRLLLQPNLDLARDTNLVSVSDSDGLISIMIEDRNAVTGTSRLSLLMAEEPGTGLVLKQWTITDAQGLDTTITLSGLDTATRPENQLFTIDYTRDVANEHR
jgi:outer membrane lipoprotein-sorting protein